MKELGIQMDVMDTVGSFLIPLLRLAHSVYAPFLEERVFDV